MIWLSWEAHRRRMNIYAWWWCTRKKKGGCINCYSRVTIVIGIIGEPWKCHRDFNLRYWHCQHWLVVGIWLVWNWLLLSFGFWLLFYCGTQRTRGRYYWMYIRWWDWLNFAVIVKGFKKIGIHIFLHLSCTMIFIVR